MSDNRGKIAVICADISPFFGGETLLRALPPADYVRINSSTPDGISSDPFTALTESYADIAALRADSLPYPLPTEFEIYALLDIDSSDKSGDPLSTLIAVAGLRGREDLKSVFGRFDKRKNFGSVALVGFGPGDPELLTIKADKLLSQADEIFYDDLVDADFLSKYRAQKIYVGKRKGKHSHVQAQINALLYESALKGSRVVRLKGGDPMVFAHGREEIDYLKSRFIDVEVVAGVSSALAAAAQYQIPLTHRGVSSSVAFVSGHNAEKAQTPNADTLVYYMAGANIAAIAKKLIESGRKPDAPAVLLSRVSYGDSRIFLSSLDRLQSRQNDYPTPVVMIVGDVVGLSKGVFPKQAERI